MRYLTKNLLFFFSLSFFVPLVSSGTISDLEITGASVLDTSGNIPIVYGGLGGSCSSTTTSTCDSCTGFKLTCNQKRISDSQLLSFQFRSTSDGYPKIFIDSDTELSGVAGSTFANKGDLATVSVAWGTVCNALSADHSNCESLLANAAITGYLYVGIEDQNTQGKLADSAQVSFKIYQPVTDPITSADCASTSELGVCSFITQPGDQRVYLDEIQVAQEFPNLINTLKIDRVRIMFSDVSWDAAAPIDNDFYEDLSVANDDEISGDAIGDLENDVFYAFSFASIDEAGNITNFMDQSLFDAACPGVGATTNINQDPMPEALEAALLACPYIAKPGEVIGLLAEDFNCFIATAAYGTGLHAHLDLLRSFRNRYLLTNEWGRQFVLSYYRWGSKASVYITKSPLLKSLARVALAPVVAFAYSVFHLGLLTTLALFILCLTIGAFAFYRLRSTKREA